MIEPSSLNLDALFPCDAESALAGPDLAEFKTEHISSEACPCTIELRLHKNWARKDPPPQPPAPDTLRTITRFHRVDLPTAGVNVSVVTLRWDVYLIDWTWVHLHHFGHKLLRERRTGSAAEQLPDVLSTFGLGTGMYVARTTAIGHGPVLIVLQGFAAVPEFEKIAREMVVTLASAKTYPPAKPSLIEARKSHSLGYVPAAFAYPQSWKAECKSCLTRPLGDSVRLTSSAPMMGPALIGVETAPAQCGVTVGMLLKAVRRGLGRMGLYFGDPRISAGPPTPRIAQVTSFESSGMMDSVSVFVTITVFAGVDGLAALWCITPNTAVLEAARAITRRAFDFVSESFHFTSM